MTREEERKALEALWDVKDKLWEAEAKVAKRDDVINMMASDIKRLIRTHPFYAMDQERVEWLKSLSADDIVKEYMSWNSIF